MITKNVDLNESTIADALEKSGLDWVVEQSEILNIGASSVIPNYKCLYRGDNKGFLGVVGKNYTPFQNFEAFAFFDTICEKHNGKIIKALEFNGGKKIMLEAIIQESFEVKKGDICQLGYQLINGFDGKIPAQISFNVKRLVCLNGLKAIDKDMSNRVMLRHSKNFQTRMEKAFNIFNIGQDYFKKFQEKCQFLVQKKIDKDMVDNFLNSLFKDQNSKKTEKKKDRIEELIFSGAGNNGESGWDLYNSVTEYVDHFSKKELNDTIEYSLNEGEELKERAFFLSMKI